MMRTWTDADYRDWAKASIEQLGRDCAWGGGWEAYIEAYLDAEDFPQGMRAPKERLLSEAIKAELRA